MGLRLFVEYAYVKLVYYALSVTSNVVRCASVCNLVCVYIKTVLEEYKLAEIEHHTVS